MEKIGIFDSGIGGATVFKEIIKKLPNMSYIYYSDSKNNPYGDKTKKEIEKICEDIVEKLIKEKCTSIVIACNTASAIAVEHLRNTYSNIDITAIEPAYKMVHDFNYNEETLVMATKGTIESEKFNKLLHKYDNHKTELIACTGLAELIENDKEDEINEYLEKHLEKYKGKVKNVVLGCTHYPLIKENIRKVLENIRNKEEKEIKFFDGAERLAENLKHKLENKKLDNKMLEIHFIDSSNNIKKEKRFFEILNKEGNKEYENNKK